MSLINIFLSFLEINLIQKLLLGFSKVYCYPVNRCQDNEHIGIHKLGELCTGEVLVNYCRNTYKLSVLSYNGYSAAANGDNNFSCINKRLYRIFFNNIHRLWGRHHLTIATAGILNHCITLFGCYFIGLFFCVESANGLCSMGKCNVIFIYQYLRYHSDSRLVYFTRRKLVLNAVLKMKPMYP